MRKHDRDNGFSGLERNIELQKCKNTALKNRNTETQKNRNTAINKYVITEIPKHRNTEIQKCSGRRYIGAEASKGQ